MKPLYSVILITLLNLASLCISKTDWQKVLLLFVPIGYAVYFISKSVFLKFKAKGRNATASFLEGLFCVLLFLKLSFIYYNLAASIILIALAFLMYKRVAPVAVHREIRRKMTTLCLVSSVLFLIPDRILLPFILLDEQMLAWRPNLKWEDFTIVNESDISKKLDGDTYEAQLVSNYVASINRVYNFPPAIIIEYMDKSKSYRRYDVQTNNSYLLNHEQIHFNIFNHFTERANDSIAKIWPCKKNEVEAIIDYFHRLKEAENEVYDSLTKHALDSVQQLKWSAKYEVK